MPESRTGILTRHFFRRFFDNDTLSTNGGVNAGETETSVVRALAAFAVPGLMVAFWLLPHYPGRNQWSTAADRYFFVLFSFVAMGAVATVEWAMLFPDRADFLILLPLGLRSSQLFLAKARALIGFLGLFLVAANAFGLILFSAVSTRSGGSFFHTAWSHFVATVLAGICSACAMLALQALTLSLLPASWFRPVSTLLQSLSIAALLLLFLLFPLCGGHMQTLLEGQTGFARFVPPLWFLGLYERLVLGDAAPAAARSLATLGIGVAAVTAAIAILTYPLAWARQKKRAIEGASQSRHQRISPVSAILHKTLLQNPQHRAIFHFLSQTIARNPRYQVYLALYSGVGLALALCSTLTFQTGNAGLVPTLWLPGMHALLPLLLFWMVSGLHAAFSFPVDMRARWVFPLSLQLAPTTPEQSPYAFPGPAAKSARLWTLLCCAALTASVLCLLLALHWSWLSLLIQTVYGACLSTILSGLFFLGRTQIPFTRPRLPGRTNLAIVFTLYTVLFPALVLLTVHWELQTESQPILLLWAVLAAAIAQLLLRTIDRLATQGIIGGFPEDETDQGPQTLGLFQ